VIELSEERGVQVRFLLGPAGTGKTFRCLEEIRAELKRAPEGPPLLFLAPKQATFQIERQLLGDDSLRGYTRLQILSFERCAEFVLAGLRVPTPRTVSETGRVMVLRALLNRRVGGLKIFHSTARLPGFAQQLSLLLREFQRAGVERRKLDDISAKVGDTTALGRKLRDTALLLDDYSEWLHAHQLEDGNRLLDIATQALRDTRTARPRIGGMWMDGFAEMTPQETEFLHELVPCCERATLAFCLEDEPREDVSWLSQWSCIGETFWKCHATIESAIGRPPEVEVLSRHDVCTRFAGNATLANLEAFWAEPAKVSRSRVDETFIGNTEVAKREDDTIPALRLVSCANPEAEAAFAAREIRRFVREHGARYRDCAVLVRQLDGYADALARVFRRYDIPCFLDRRESVAHHALAELTRCALRTVAFRWQSEDWFGALKSGLLPANETDLDVLENAALACGWRGDTWLQPLNVPGDASLSSDLERVRQQIVPPFVTLSRALTPENGRITGTQLASAVRIFWAQAEVEARLEEWTRARVSEADPNPALHRTVLEQLQNWLADIELAFAGEAMELREWLAILEAGLSGLTVGVIPPSLDQVLIGAIDRSRSPDLRLAFVLGVNEGVFPAPPERPRILNDAERSRLEAENVSLGLSQKRRLGHERYYGYIAFTRSCERLVATYAKVNAAGDALSPSLFVNRLREIAPEIAVEEFAGNVSFHDAEHACEVISPLLRNLDAGPSDTALRQLLALNTIAPVMEKWRNLACTTIEPNKLRLSKAIADRLYPKQLKTSVSGLEQFAACPFKFFVARGLRAGERIEFEPDNRQRGSFQHQVLQLFQQRLAAEKRRWRDVPPGDAEQLVAEIGEAQLRAPENSVFRRDAAAEFTARTLIRNLQKLAATLVTWAQRYDFEPGATELSFDAKTGDAWRIDLNDGRELLLNGRMDRVDLWRGPDGRVLAAVMDYKSSARKLDNVKLEAGLDLQLLSYLGVLRHVSAVGKKLGIAEIIPAGAFYISLAPKRVSAKGRADARPANPFQHVGRFQRKHLALFDNRGEAKGEQFRFSIKQDGGFAKNGNDGLPEVEFNALLDLVENHLRRFGTELLDGSISIDPFGHGGVTACDHCDYAAVCRFDAWTQRYRLLKGVSETSGGSE
jgi:ATP-dependent helicase/nuclease subunit B